VFLGAAAGIMAARLPGFALTPAVAVGLGAAVAAVLKLPLTGVVLGTLMTVHAGVGQEPLIIVGVVVAYLVAVVMTPSTPDVKRGSTGAAGATGPAADQDGAPQPTAAREGTT
jgi:hypothetical protein